jgi:hypothetical protein
MASHVDTQRPRGVAFRREPAKTREYSD